MAYKNIKLLSTNGYFLDVAQTTDLVKVLKNNIISFKLPRIDVLSTSTPTEVHLEGQVDFFDDSSLKPDVTLYIIIPDGIQLFSPATITKYLGYLNELQFPDNTVFHIALDKNRYINLAESDIQITEKTNYEVAENNTILITDSYPQVLETLTLQINCKLVCNSQFCSSDWISISSTSDGYQCTFNHGDTSETVTVGNASCNDEIFLVISYDINNGGTVKLYDIDGNELSSANISSQNEPITFSSLNFYAPYIYSVILLNAELPSSDLNKITHSSNKYNKYVVDISPLNLSEIPLAIYKYNDVSFSVALETQESDITDDSFVTLQKLETLYSNGTFTNVYSDFIKEAGGYIIQRKFKSIRSDAEVEIMYYNSDIFS